VIGPISDIEHTSKNKNDSLEDSDLDEMDDDDDDWEDDDDLDLRRLKKKEDDYSVIYDENTSARPAND